MRTWQWVALATSAVSACGGIDGKSTEAIPETSPDEAELLGGRCAGPYALACEPGNFCATSKKSKRCPGDETKGVCRPVPDACTHIYEPACGCDGQTYGNACQAALAGVALAYEGPCAPFCGGFAGLPCPGRGTCADNGSDSCDPEEGDADCPSLCSCDVTDACGEGEHWDISPEVCGCVAD